LVDVRNVYSYTVLYHQKQRGLFAKHDVRTVCTSIRDGKDIEFSKSKVVYYQIMILSVIIMRAITPGAISS